MAVHQDVARPIPGAGASRFQIDLFRAEADRAGVRFARQPVLSSFAAAVELNGLWVFVSNFGPVATSDTFLGDLIVLGDTGPEPRVVTATRGRLAVATRDGLFVTDGRSVTRAGTTPSPVFEAAFLDANTGLAALEDGGLALTRDGGATWNVLDLGVDLAVGVTLDGAALRVESTRGALVLGADGRLVPAEGPASSTPEARDDEARSAVGEAFRHRFRDELEAESDTPRLPDGTTLTIAQGAIVHRGADGSVLGRTRAGDDVGARCQSTYRWGRGLAVRCGQLFRTEDGETFAPVFPPARQYYGWWGSGRLLFSDDGVHLVVATACDAMASFGQRANPGAACALRDGVGHWRELPPVEGRGAPDSMHGALLLYNACDEPGCSATLVDVDSGQARPVTFARTQDDLVSGVPLKWTPDGALVGIAVARGAPDARRWLLSGPPDAPLAVRPLPDDVRQVVFADRLRGITLGEWTRSLWRTLDGGSTWQAIEAPIEGANVPWIEPRATRCDAQGCDVGGVLSLRGWGPVSAPENRVLSLVQPRPAPRLRDTEPGTRLRCAPSGPAQPSPWRATPTNGTPTRTWLLGALRAQETPRRGADTGSVDLTWWIEGTRPRTLRLPRRGNEDLSYATPYGGNGGVLLTGSRGLAWVTRDGQHAVLERAPAVFRSAGSFLRAGLVLPDAGGGVVVLSGGLTRRDFLVAFQVSARGALGAYRAFGRGDALVGLARVRGRWLYATVARDGTVRAAPLSGGASERLGTVPARVTPCASGAPRGAAVVSLATSSHAGAPFAVEGFRTALARMDVAVTPTGACLLGVATSGYFQDRQRSSLVWLRAERARLVGSDDDLERRQPVRCEVTP